MPQKSKKTEANSTVKIKVIDTLRFIDIDAGNVPQVVWQYLNNFFIVYRDNLLSEHLISVSDAVESDGEFLPKSRKLRKEVVEYLEELNRVADKKKAAYVRFIKP